MMKNHHVLIILILLPFFITPANAQTIINITETTPCFLNYTATWHILENCGANDDWLVWIVSGFEWVTGGNFSMIVVSVLIISIYVKYQEILYPIFIGLIYLPVAAVFFPAAFLSWAIIMAFVGIGVLIWWIYVRQTQ